MRIVDLPNKFGFVCKDSSQGYLRIRCTANTKRDEFPTLAEKITRESQGSCVHSRLTYDSPLHTHYFSAGVNHTVPPTDFISREYVYPRSIVGPLPSNGIFWVAGIGTRVGLGLDPREGLLGVLVGKGLVEVEPGGGCGDAGGLVSVGARMLESAHSVLHWLVRSAVVFPVSVAVALVCSAACVTLSMSLTCSVSLYRRMISTASATS